jgi:ubiquinone/menaquinone biosynthesis C-methylase UbiE
MDRIDKEREFHDRRFRDEEPDLRQEMGKYYSIYTINTAFFNGLLSQHLPGADVLEYGCAKGDKALRWARAGARLKGIDISGEAVRIANQRASDEGLPAQFFAMNAEQMDFADRSFDVVFGEGILHHLDLNKAYREISRVLKSSGRAIFVEPLGHNPVLNLYRKLTPKMRTDDEHPLLERDFELMRTYFEDVRVRYFHLATLAAVPLRKSPLFKPVLSALQSIDGALLQLVPPIRRWAWVAVVEMIGPKQQH